MRITDPDREAMRAYREENFAVKVEPHESFTHEEEFTLLVTTNGNIWQGIHLTRSEAHNVIVALKRALKQ